jgi:lipoprotein NlpD
LRSACEALVEQRERALKLTVSMQWIRSSSAQCALAAILASSLLAGCASSPSGGVSVVDRNHRDRVTSGQYVVRRGDTLWSIASRFGWDWRDLAQVNNLRPPHVIYPGQTIRFSGQPSRAVAARPVAPPPAQRPDTPTVVTNPVPTPPPLTQPSAPVAKPPAASTPNTPVARSASGWAWPAGGAVIGRFSSNGSLNKGIDIAGELGQPVLAASDGAVVYAGSGLRGYGELVIIKHSDTYVSAYGHNRRLLVQEGQQVKAGQKIAEMGSTGTDRVKLHFEIRRQGKPVDPLQYLPKR